MKVIHSADLYIVLAVFHTSEIIIEMCIIWIAHITGAQIIFLSKSHILRLIHF